MNTAYPAKRDRIIDNNSLDQVAQAIKDAGELYMSFFLEPGEIIKYGRKFDSVCFYVWCYIAKA